MPRLDCSNAIGDANCCSNHNGTGDDDYQGQCQRRNDSGTGNFKVCGVAVGGAVAARGGWRRRPRSERGGNKHRASKLKFFYRVPNSKPGGDHIPVNQRTEGANRCTSRTT